MGLVLKLIKKGYQFQKDDTVLFPNKYQDAPINPPHNLGNDKRGSNDFELSFSKKTVNAHNNFKPLPELNTDTFNSIHKGGENITKEMDILQSHYKEVYFDLNLNQIKNLQKPFGQYGSALSNDTIFQSDNNQESSFSGYIDDKINNKLLPLSKKDIETYQQIQKVGNKIRNETDASMAFLYARYKHNVLILRPEQKEKTSRLTYQLDSALINRQRFNNQTHQTIVQNKYSTIVQQQPSQTSNEIRSSNINKIYRRDIIDSINSSII